MILYTVYGFDGDEFYATQREALAAARKLADDPEWEGMETVEVTRHLVSPLTKKNVMQILQTQGGAWSAEREVIAVLRKRVPV